MNFNLPLTLLACFAFINISIGQCPQTSVVLSTQLDIDNFSFNYPGCTMIPDGIHIIIQDDSDGITDITNLEGLSQVVSIEGFLQIRDNPILPNLDGLSQLSFIGLFLEIRNNDALADLEGLSQLLSIGTLNQLPGTQLNIYDNDALLNVDGLSQVSSIGGSIFIYGNDALSDLDGLSQLSLVEGSLEITDNDALTDLNGLSQIISISEYLTIDGNNNLTNLNGLNQLSSVGISFTIIRNNNLMNLDGLNQLTSIGGYLLIENNNDLMNLDGLINLSSIAGGAGTGLELTNNPQLSQCCALCPLLAADAADPNTIGGSIVITDNDTGCSSETDINACNPCGLVTASIPEYDSNQLNIYPNPINSTLHFQYDSSKDELIFFTIQNALGQLVFRSQSYTNQLANIDVTSYPAGIYVLEILHGDESISQLFSISR